MNERSAEIERHAEDVREQMAYTADRLRERLTPGQLVDEAAHYFRHSDGAVSLHNLQTQARDNPMALALVGAGLAWLMFGSGTSRASRDRRGNGEAWHRNGRARSQRMSARAEYSSEFGPDHRFEDSERSWTAGAADMAGRVRDETRSYAESVTSGASDAYRSATSAVGEAYSGATSTAAETYRSARDSAAYLRDTLSERSRSLTDGVSDTVGQIGATGRNAAQSARQTFDELLDREPLIVGAIGLAVGAAIGALMPRTDIEDEYLGDASENIKRGASELMEEGLEEAKDIAAKGYAAAKQAMQEENLVPGDRSIAEKVGHVAEAAVGAVKDETRSTAPDFRDR